MAFFSIIQLKVKKIKNEDLEDKNIIQHLSINSKEQHNKKFKKTYHINEK